MAFGLDFGWVANDVRESHWPDDRAFLEPDPDKEGATRNRIPQPAREAWAEDGDASHLREYAVKGQDPVRITFRALNVGEKSLVAAKLSDTLNETGSIRAALNQAHILAFRMGVDFPDLPLQWTDEAGASHRRIVRDSGVMMLAIPFVNALDGKYKDMVDFYGEKIFDATFPSVAEKKASLLRFTKERSAADTAPPSSPPTQEAA